MRFFVPKREKIGLYFYIKIFLLLETLGKKTILKKKSVVLMCGENMNFLRFSSILIICGVLVACGTKKVKPVVCPKPLPPPAPIVDTVRIPVEVEAQFSLDSDVDRYSYALGMDLGKALVNIDIPVNLDAVYGAMRDILDSSREIRLSDSAAAEASLGLLQLIQKRKSENSAAIARKALEEQAVFLAKNIQDTSVRVTTKGVQYIVLKEGRGIKPKLSDRVRVHFSGSLLNGLEFDNSVERNEPLEFPIRAVIEGWQDLLLVMREGMKVKAWIPSALAYGEKGIPPTIPSNALLVFEVELLKVLVDGP